MVAFIKFLENFYEKKTPLIQLTKSKNGQTGTATFIFLSPEIFDIFIFSEKHIENSILCWNKKEITSENIDVFYRNGEPYLLKTIFIFKNAKEWFNFLEFMFYYSNEKGLFFSENYNFFSKSISLFKE
jgi:photosystem II protein